MRESLKRTLKAMSRPFTVVFRPLYKRPVQWFMGKFEMALARHVGQPRDNAHQVATLREIARLSQDIDLLIQSVRELSEQVATLKSELKSAEPSLLTPSVVSQRRAG